MNAGDGKADAPRPSAGNDGANITLASSLDIQQCAVLVPHSSTLACISRSIVGSRNSPLIVEENLAIHLATTFALGKAELILVD